MNAVKGQVFVADDFTQPFVGLVGIPTTFDGYGITDISTFGKTLVDDANAAAARTTLGLGALAVLGDGDKGDVTVSSSGAVWTIDAAAVTLAKMANLDQDKFIIRTTASTGVPETGTCTAAGRALIDDANAAAQRTTLGLGTSAVQPYGGGLIYADGSVPGGNTIANTASETAFASSYTFVGAALSAQTLIRVVLTGVYSTDAIAPTLRIRGKLGSTVILDTGTITTVLGITNGGWTAEFWVIVTAIGASGSVESQGRMELSTAETTALVINAENAAAVGSIDFTADKALTFTVEWGTAATTNTITARQMMVWADKVGALP